MFKYRFACSNKDNILFSINQIIANESVPIYTHGEKEMLAYEQHMQEGIDVDISTVSEMINICNYLGMNSIDYLGNVDVSDAKTGTYEKTYQ